MKLFHNERRPEGQKGGSPALAFFVFALTLGLAFFSYQGFSWGGEGKSSASVLSSAASRLETEGLPLRVVATRGEPGRIVARVSFLDRDGKEISVLERSLRGDSLIIDFYLVPVPAAEKGRSLVLAFPRRLRGDREALSEGLQLFDAYTQGGFPAVYAGGSGDLASDAKSKKALSDLFAALAKDDAAGQSPSSAVRSAGGMGGAYRLELVLAGFEPGKPYDIVTNADGSISARPSRP